MKLDIVLSERQREIERGMVFDVKNIYILKTLVGIDNDISSSVVNLCDHNVEKIEINLKEHNLKEQFKEKAEKMIQQNNMDNMSERFVDNFEVDVVEESKNKKAREKKLL